MPKEPFWLACNCGLKHRLYSPNGITPGQCPKCNNPWSETTMAEFQQWANRVAGRVEVEQEATVRADSLSATEQRTDGADPRVVANVESLMREAKEQPIGSVRGHVVAHFKVDVWGGYFLNGKRVSLEEVKRECARLGQIGGVVFYYRKNLGEVPREAEAVIAAICEANLPLTFAGRDYDPEVKVAEYFLPAGAW